MLSKKRKYRIDELREIHEMKKINEREKRKDPDIQDRVLRALGLYPKNSKNRAIFLAIMEIMKPRKIIDKYEKYFDKTDIELLRNKISERSFETLLYNSGVVDIKLYKKLNLSYRDFHVSYIANRTYENMYKLLRRDPYLDEFDIGIPYTKPKNAREKKYKEKLENFETEIRIYHCYPRHPPIICIHQYILNKID